MLPCDFPHRSTIRYYFDKWTEDSTSQRLNERLRVRIRTAAGGRPQPNTGSIARQSAKTAEVGGMRGFNGGKKVNG
jgi:putative transposase